MCAPPFAIVCHRHFRRKESERQASFFLRVTFSTDFQAIAGSDIKHSMDYSRRRSAAVTVVAVPALVGSPLPLLCSAVVFFELMVKLPRPNAQVPPFIRNA